jgi:hypothetical protein
MGLSRKSRHPGRAKHHPAVPAERSTTLPSRPSEAHPVIPGRANLTLSSPAERTSPCHPRRAKRGKGIQRAARTAPGSPSLGPAALAGDDSEVAGEGEDVVIQPGGHHWLLHAPSSRPCLREPGPPSERGASPARGPGSAAQCFAPRLVRDDTFDHRHSRPNPDPLRPRPAWRGRGRASACPFPAPRR